MSERLKTISQGKGAATPLPNLIPVLLFLEKIEDHVDGKYHL
jgi:hypothetical protein